MSFKYVTIDSNDPHTEKLIGKINVWRDYKLRARAAVFSTKGKLKKKATVGRLKHGRRVRLINKEGHCLKIKFGLGKTGYISDWFTEEYKNG